jgi:hypothetical protein
MKHIRTTGKNMRLAPVPPPKNARNLSTASNTAPPPKRRGRPKKQPELVNGAKPSEATTRNIFIKITACDKNSAYILAHPLRWFAVAEIVSPFDEKKFKIGDKVVIESVIDGVMYNIQGAVNYENKEEIPNSIVSISMFKNSFFVIG